MSGDGLSVSGGSTGMAASVADLKVFAHVLRQAGSDLASLAPDVARAAVDEDVLAAGLICPDILPGVLAAIAAAELGPDGVLTRAAALGTVGTLLDATAYTYEAADAAGAALLDQIQAQLGFAAGLLLPAVAAGGAVVLLGAAAQNPRLAAQLLAYAKSGQIGPDLQDFLFRHPEVTEILTRSAPGLLQGGLTSLSLLLGPQGPAILSTLSGGHWPTTDYEDALKGLLALGGNAGLLEDTGDFHLDTEHPRSRDVHVTGIQDIFNLQGSMNEGQPLGPDGKDQLGQLRVITVTKDGVTRLIVQVPGTESWDPSRGTNPVDTATNVNAMSLRDTVMRQQIIDAIRQAQLAHPGAEVMLTGHSQGGIVAATLASDPRLVRDLHITSLVTGGSPIGRMPIDSSVSVLSVEHTQDPVPMLDGTGNPDRPNWTTVRRDLPVESVSGSGRPAVFDAHATNNYADTGAMIDRSSDPAVQDWRARNQQFFGASDDRAGHLTSVTSTVYDIKPGK